MGFIGEGKSLAEALEDAITKKQRADFDDFVLKWSRRDQAHHARYGTTGLDFAWDCWREATRVANAAVMARRKEIEAEGGDGD